MDDSTTFLTPNRRLSATLLKQYNQSQVNAGHTWWVSLDILPFTSWIQRLWQEYSLDQTSQIPFLLTAQQELVLWEEILQTFPANEALLQLSETAKLAKTAWGTLKHWQIDLTHPSLKTTEDSNAFLLWATHFQRSCQENNWLDINSVIKIICEKILKQRLKLPKRLITRGFTEFSPLQKYLFNCCEQIGIQVVYDREAQRSTLSAQRISLADTETEIRIMARWAKSLLTTNANLSVGCVVPNLERIRDHLLPIFTDVFSEGYLHSLDCTTQPFNITAGKSLASYPIIYAALQLLSLHTKIVTTNDLRSLLLSPFLGDAEYEQIQRAQFDARLRRANRMNISLQKLIHPQEKLSLYTSCPRLAKRLKKFLALLQQQPSLLPVSEWVNIFMQALSLLGWPGERSINSQEYQVIQRWLGLLKEYQTFDMILPKKSYQNTLHYLMRLSASVIFQPQSTDTAVQILGVLEATDLPFDYMWVMGLDDNAWPPAAKPNPFIPQQLQVSQQMPHSSAEHEFTYSQRLTEQLMQSTQHIIFSHAKNNNDCELRPSPLISHLTEIREKELNLSEYTSLAERSKQSRLIETIQDTQAPLVQSKNIQGGAMIFKLQAACPFKAFAELRLKAYPLESPSVGLKPLDRGKITHKALELIWQEIQSSEKLHSYADIELQKILQAAITQAIHLVAYCDTAKSRYFSLEKERLQNLLWNWLQLEKSRPSFKVIAQEEERVINIANLQINLRIDRIDELATGEHLIIDYKTGKNNQIKHWLGDRLEEPQLPLYCISAPNAVTGITFAEVHPASLTFKGVSKKSLNIDAIKPLAEILYNEEGAWEQQILAWQQGLEKLGNDFAQGNAEVNPKNEMETCKQCHLQAFCRVSAI